MSRRSGYGRPRWLWVLSTQFVLVMGLEIGLWAPIGLVVVLITGKATFASDAFHLTFASDYFSFLAWYFGITSVISFVALVALQWLLNKGEK